MIITNKLTMELTHNSSSPVIYAVQDDRYSRCLELTLLANGSPWVIPEDAAVLIRYLKSDGKGGEYNTLPDENTAWTAEENVLTLTLAPQVLTCPGVVNLAVTLMRGQMQVSTFAILICVEPSVGTAACGSEEYFHVPGFLPAPRDASAGQFLQVTAVDAAGHVTGLKAASIGENASVTVEPSEDDIPKVFFGAALPQTKDDTVMSFRYISKTADISGYCNTKAQGNSSMAYPKKNQTVKLYKDAECTEKLKVDFKGWGKQNKFCFKANWIDLTHARNIVSARLWGDMVKSRANYTEIPELLRTSPNQGAVDGFPVKVYADGIYQGRFTINIPKDAWMANMDDELDEHCILCGEADNSAFFRESAVIDGSDWSDEVHDTVPENIKTRWNEVIHFVMNSTDEEFVSGIGNYFDVDSLIDYYLFGMVTCHYDGFKKNQLFMTYDGQKWYATAYDMDSTWGLWWDGSAFVSHDFALYHIDTTGASTETNLLYNRLVSLFIDPVKARWDELKNGALSIDNIISRFERFTDIAPPYLVEEDYAQTTADGMFTAIPQQGTNNIQQIRSYALNRCRYVDEYIGRMGSDPDLLYILPSETTFDGVDDYINTGLTPFSETQDFTILMDIDPSQNTAAANVIAVRDAFNITTEGNAPTSLTPYDSAYGWPFINNVIQTNGQRTKVALVFSGGIASAMYWKIGEGSLESTTSNGSFKSVTTNNPLYIGSYYGSGGEPALPWKGTVYSFEFWDHAMTAAEVAEKLT